MGLDIGLISAVSRHFCATCNRVRLSSDGQLILYDYKTGRPPTKRQQEKFDKQLLLEAAMIENGAFEGLDPATVSGAVFLGVGSPLSTVEAPLDTEPPAQVWQGLRDLIGAYLQVDQGYTSRLMVERDGFPGNYDQLARFGEWDPTDPATPELLK